VIQRVDEGTYRVEFTAAVLHSGSLPDVRCPEGLAWTPIPPNDADRCGWSVWGTGEYLG
jgi:hypothetical protein